ncbi:hypothetical protein VTI74DRAFT_10205 [Chaetomium olivicolor]
MVHLPHIGLPAFLGAVSLTAAATAPNNVHADNTILSPSPTAVADTAQPNINIVIPATATPAVHIPEGLAHILLDTPTKAEVETSSHGNADSKMYDQRRHPAAIAEMNERPARDKYPACACTKNGARSLPLGWAAKVGVAVAGAVAGAVHLGCAI